MKKRFIFCLLTCTLNSFSFTHAEEANTFERITVTSTFRDVNLDQLAASASVVDEDILALRQAFHIEDIYGVIPNVNFTAGASRGRFVQIRGIGERSQFAEPINPSVNLYVDAFDFSGLGAAALLFDMQQVEVFRGPQATLFGGGALAGAVNLLSHRANDGSPDYLLAQYATDNALVLEGGYSIEINDTVSARIAGIRNKADGFIHNTFLGRDDTNNIDESAAKIDLRFDFSEDSSLALQYRWYDIKNGYDAFSLDNDRTTRSDQPGFDTQKTHAFSAEWFQSINAGELYIRGTTASHDIGYGYDEDWTFVGFHPDGYSSIDSYFRDIDTHTAEIRLSNTPQYALFNGNMDWTVGVFTKDINENLNRESTFGGSFNSEFTPRTTAAYINTETALSSQWRLDMGLRLERFDFDYRNVEGVDVSNASTVLGGKLALNYSDENHLYYGSISRGFKAAGVNPDQQVSEAQRFFDTEYNWNYELGVKSFWMDNTVTSRVALFHMRRRDTQISDFDVQPRADGSSDFIDIIDNADLGINEGVEVELQWQATEDWQLTSNIGYLNAYFEDFTRRNGEVIEKRAQAQAPRWTLFLASDYQINDAWSFNVNADMRDAHFFSDGHNERSPFTVILNSNLVFNYQDWVVTVWGRNILDRVYYTRGFGGFGNDPRNGYETGPYYQLGNPRQVGVSVRYTF